MGKLKSQNKAIITAIPIAVTACPRIRLVLMAVLRIILLYNIFLLDVDIAKFMLF